MKRGNRIPWCNRCQRRRNFYRYVKSGLHRWCILTWENRPGTNGLALCEAKRMLFALCLVFREPLECCALCRGDIPNRNPVDVVLRRKMTQVDSQSLAKVRLGFWRILDLPSKLIRFGSGFWDILYCLWQEVRNNATNERRTQKLLNNLRPADLMVKIRIPWKLGQRTKPKTSSTSSVAPAMVLTPSSQIPNRTCRSKSTFSSIFIPWRPKAPIMIQKSHESCT